MRLYQIHRSKDNVVSQADTLADARVLSRAYLRRAPDSVRNLTIKTDGAFVETVERD